MTVIESIQNINTRLFNYIESEKEKNLDLSIKLLWSSANVDFTNNDILDNNCLLLATPILGPSDRTSLGASYNRRDSFIYLIKVFTKKNKGEAGHLFYNNFVKDFYSTFLIQDIYENGVIIVSGPNDSQEAEGFIASEISQAYYVNKNIN